MAGVKFLLGNVTFKCKWICFFLLPMKYMYFYVLFVSKAGTEISHFDMPVRLITFINYSIGTKSVILFILFSHCVSILIPVL